jgi:folate-binding protein YgfZ
VGDVTADYLALRRAAGAAVSRRAVVRASGPETRRFLQGQLSQDVEGLVPGEARWTLLLEPQGKVVAWLRVWGRPDPDELLLDVEPELAARVLARLERFKLRTRCELELLEWDLVSVRGPEAPSAGELAADAVLAAEVPWPGVGGVDLLGEVVGVPDGVPVVGTDAVRSVRIEAGWPTNVDELAADDEPSVIPGEAGRWLVEASVSFTKGCYTGQELVARVDARGNNTPRHLRGVVLGTNVLPPVGARIVDDGVERGALTSVGESLDLRAPVALAFVHRSVEPPASVELRWRAPDGSEALAPAQVRELPLLDR